MIIEDEHDMIDNLQYISNGDPVELEHDVNKMHLSLEHIFISKMILLSITCYSTTVYICAFNSFGPFMQCIAFEPFHVFGFK
jgi:hypothetical protein